MLNTQNQPSIGDYGLIGDCRAAALVSRGGSIDWLCLPRFDSPSVFGALLDTERGGRFVICPTEPAEATRRYLPETNVLETTFRTERGVLRLTDCFAVASEDTKRHTLWPDHELLRRVECVEGELEIEVRFDPRPNYGRSRPRTKGLRSFGWITQAGRQVMVLQSELPLSRSAGSAGLAGVFTLSAGTRRFLSLSFTDMVPQIAPPLGDQARDRLNGSVTWWRQWAGQCGYQGAFRNQVVRSLLVLKLMTYAPSGAIVAAPTTSLPERIGGPRNWDYRYCWLRDASMTLRALAEHGYLAEARAFLAWMLHATVMDRPGLRIMYNVHGDTRTSERELHHLAGYRGSRPVRVGNGAGDQLQLDVYGSVVDAAYEYFCRGGELSRAACRTLRGFGIRVCKQWQKPDEGIWELRSARRHHTLSKAMCWVTLDRLLRLHEAGCLRVPVERFRENKRLIRKEIESRGYNPALASYTGVLGGDHLDAALLLLGLYGYASPSAPRMANTRRRVEERLGTDGLIYRYDVGEKQDGFKTGEGAFTLCGFWNVQLLVRVGEVEEAERRFGELLRCANDLGLYSEEIDAGTNELLGNFPQAFTHVGLINAASALDAAQDA